MLGVVVIIQTGFSLITHTTNVANKLSIGISIVRVFIIRRASVGVCIE